MILGIIIGLLIAIFVFVILSFFRSEVEQRVKIIERVISNAGPKVKGEIFMPEDDTEIARREHIEKNNSEGRPTSLSELE